MTTPAGSPPSVAEAVGDAIMASLDHSGADPGPDDHLEIVRRTAEAEGAVRDLLHQAVAGARGAGVSWASLGSVLDMSRQAAQQRFGRAEPDPGEATGEERWLGPVTAFDELRELEIAGSLGWHTVEAGLLRHRMVRTDTQWEHKRIVWSGLRRHTEEGWQVGCRAFPWIYLVRDTGLPVAG